MTEDPQHERGRRYSRTTIARCVAALSAACMGGAVLLSGCGKALFPESEPRSQFDRYDRSRDEYAPTYIEDEFGRRQPNLQGRLSPKR